MDYSQLYTINTRLSQLLGRKYH